MEEAKKDSDVILACRARAATQIKAWREAANISREQLAAMMHRSMATVQRWERDGDPRLSEVAAMEEFHPGIMKMIFPDLFAKASQDASNPGLGPTASPVA